MNRKVTLTTAAASSLGATLANAVINTAAVNTNLSSNGDEVFIDVDTGAFSTASFTGKDLRIEFLQGSASYHAKASIDGESISDIINSAGSSKVDRFSYGDTLSGSAVGGQETENSDGTGDWGGFTGIAYLGFYKDGHAGWVELDYQAANPGGSVEVRSFAYGTAGEITEAGVVPEPANAAALCALLAGSAAVFSRRRRTA